MNSAPHQFWRLPLAMKMSIKTHKIDLPEQIEKLEAGKSYWTFIDDGERTQGRLLALGSKIIKAGSAPMAIQLPFGQFRSTGKVKYVFDLDGALSRYTGKNADKERGKLIDVQKSEIWSTWACLSLYPENIAQIIDYETKIVELKKMIIENSRISEQELHRKDWQIRKTEQELQQKDRQMRRR